MTYARPDYGTPHTWTAGIMWSRARSRRRGVFYRGVLAVRITYRGQLAASIYLRSPGGGEWRLN